MKGPEKKPDQHPHIFHATKTYFPTISEIALIGFMKKNSNHVSHFPFPCHSHIHIPNNSDFRHGEEEESLGLKFFMKLRSSLYIPTDTQLTHNLSVYKYVNIHKQGHKFTK